jgi:hypothetical protein
MEANFYNKITELINKGYIIKVTYSPHHKGCECFLDTNIEDQESIDFLQEKFNSWFYEDLVENYLLPNNIYGAGDFSFILKNSELFVESDIWMQSDAYDESFSIFEYFDLESINFLQKVFEEKIIDNDHFLIDFEYYDKLIKELKITYFEDQLEDYIDLDFPKIYLNEFENVLINAVNKMQVYSSEHLNSYINASCYENRISITEGWPFEFKLNKEG